MSLKLQQMYWNDEYHMENGIWGENGDIQADHCEEYWKLAWRSCWSVVRHMLAMQCRHWIAQIRTQNNTSKCIWGTTTSNSIFFPFVALWIWNRHPVTVETAQMFFQKCLKSNFHHELGGLFQHAKTGSEFFCRVTQIQCILLRRWRDMLYQCVIVHLSSCSVRHEGRLSLFVCGVVIKFVLRLNFEQTRTTPYNKSQQKTRNILI